MISALFEHATSDTGLGEPEHLSVAATGGYGRGVLAPFSDIDLLFLTADEPSPADAAGGGVHALFPVGPRAEGRPRHALDRRLPGRGRQGHHDPHRAARRAATSPATRHCSRDFHDRFRAACKEAGVAEYIAAKQAERDVRHRRYGDSPFVVEPNVKEGRGGLRDLQTLYWIARYVYDTQTMGELADVGDVLSPVGGAGMADAPGSFCGPCGSTCTTSPAAPRSG